MVIAFLRMNCTHPLLSVHSGHLTGGEYNGYVAFDADLPSSWQGFTTFTDDNTLDTNDNTLDHMVDVHGGITLDCLMEEMLDEPIIPLTAIPSPEELKKYRCIGFDTLHCSDTKERWPIEAIKAETFRLKKQIEELIANHNKC